MEELQARIRAIRASQTEINLASQSYSAFDVAGDIEAQDGKKVVEMRERSPVIDEAMENGTVQKSPTKRKAQNSSKRKSQSTPTKQKAAVPFRHLRDGGQQPFVDELRRLEAQAERINQLLAERATRKAQPQAFDGRSDGQIQEWEQAEKLPRNQSVPTRSPTFASRKPSSKSSQQVHQSYGGGEVSSMSEFNDEETERLKAQAERINQLLNELEATIRQGGTNPDPVYPGYSPIETHPERSRADLRPSFSDDSQYSSDVSSFLNSQAQMPLDRNMKRAVQEAGETAQALRYLSNRERIGPSSDWHEGIAKPRSKRPALGPIRQLGLRLRRFLQVPTKPVDRIGDAVLWIVLSAVIRLGARFLVMVYPALSPVVLVLMFVPTALAVYLAVFVPRAGFVSIYRLFLITLGLLLGGRL